MAPVQLRSKDEQTAVEEFLSRRRAEEASLNVALEAAQDAVESSSAFASSSRRSGPSSAGSFPKKHASSRRGSRGHSPLTRKSPSPGKIGRGKLDLVQFGPIWN